MSVDVCVMCACVCKCVCVSAHMDVCLVCRVSAAKSEFGPCKTPFILANRHYTASVRAAMLRAIFNTFFLAG